MGPRPLVLATMLVASSCTLAVTYPSPESERSFATCNDGIDNDLDGLLDCLAPQCRVYCQEVCRVVLDPGEVPIDDDHDGRTDCEDPDCTGVCPEDRVEACADGIDQDGDHLRDFADPGCWPFARVEIQSCADARGTDASWDFDGTDELWTGDADALATDPMGRFDGRSFVLSSSGAHASASFAAGVTGLVVGMHVELDVYFEPHTTELYIDLDVEDVASDFERLSAHAFPGTDVTQPDQGDLDAVAVWHSLSPTGVRMPWSGLVGWYRITLSVEDDAPGHDVFWVRVYDGDTEVASASRPTVIRGAESVGSGRTPRATHRFGLSLDARHAPGSPPVIIGAISVHLDAYEPCGAWSPSMDSLGGGAGTFVAAAAADAGTTCLLGARFDGGTLPWLVRSVDRGTTWTDTTVMPSPGDSWRPLGLAMHEGAFHVLLWDDPITFTDAPDCRALAAPSTTMLAPRIQGHVIGYSVTDTHREILWWEGGPAAVALGYWLDQVPQDVEPIYLGNVPATLGVVRATRIADDIVFVSQEGLATMALPPRSRETGATFATLGPSGLAGTCDETAIETPLLVMDATPAVTDADVVATGSLYWYCDRAMASGVVAHRIVIRTP